jgi:hypothetical protein
VYAHYRPGTSEIFYIGKGSWTPRKTYKRAKSNENRNVIWRRTVEKCGGFDSGVLADFYIEADAFAYEIDQIALHGRRDRDGLLVNLTDGGEGAVGRPASSEANRKRAVTIALRTYAPRISPMKGRSHTAEARAAISRGVAGDRHPLFGTKLSEETRAKMSAGIRRTHPKSKPVIDRATGITYLSAHEAARQLGLNINTLSHWLSGRYPNKSTLEIA